MKSWNLFWSDYSKLCEGSIRFCKKHWFGTLVYIIVFGLYMAACFTGYLDELVCRISGAFESLKMKLAIKGKHEKE